MSDLTPGGYRSEFTKDNPKGTKITMVKGRVPIKEIILTYLRTELRGRKASCEEIAEGVGRSVDNTRGHLNELYREGKIGKERAEGDLPEGGSRPYMYWLTGDVEDDG